MSELSYAADSLQSVGTPSLWAITILGVLVLLALDFLVTRRPHEVSLKEALGWSAFYIALPMAFGVWVWQRYGSDQGLDFYAGYLVEKSLSVDNLFVFMLLLAAFAVPSVLAQRVLLFGITGALVLRGIFIALGAAALQTLDFAFLIFALILLVTAAKLLRDAFTGHEQAVDITNMRSVRLLRRFMPVVHEYHGTKMTVRVDGRRALTPLALVVVAVLATDVVFAVDSVPAVYGITEDPYLVFATNAFALLGLRALYFVLHAALSRLVHLTYGLAIILAFIGVKLGLHWAHGIWEGVPVIPTEISLLVIIVVLTVVTLTSLRATRNVVPGSKEVVTERK
ncbi:integral membrane protein, TerC family [Micromonospora phaseoli]|uniref:Integral membrane protein, TerC family n=1 Tax=Micromonospora phaseoli TaxID=1144548 RepID=A0A1H6Z1G8_9ACTN|nr:TerC/Alx family metal homeostasis membrane protein [Micromonospora phaseoli]PZW00331.1 TerC family integral membrane protein [Micromonospora phaseoli]GIJ76809.1 tellurium resistance protein TerC [Micromonospora phaseoli]SEJ43442.1 integral membrane protein, TerC family [Micromonospora phaseoli]